MLAKQKVEVRLRNPENWFKIVDRDEDRVINVAELTAHLTKISFIENKTFWAELNKIKEEFKSSNPDFS